jgi:energy-converting hydrogenase A subunit M
MNQIKKLSKKLNLNDDVVKNIIVYNHELNNFIAKKKLKKVYLEFTIDSTNLIKNIAKTLKVDNDAVIGYLLREYVNTLDKKRKL